LILKFTVPSLIWRRCLSGASVALHPEGGSRP
jgi:hypothetical protein